MVDSVVICALLNERAFERFDHVVSARRMPTEHAIDRMKWWPEWRYWRRPPDRFARAGKAIPILAGLS